jgi:Cdc6-like AAA superfamily ATPase
MLKINPFAPNSPVNPGTFVGRLDEIRRLETSLVQTKAGRPAHFMITGERGIGKSSLLSYTKYLAEGHIPVDTLKMTFLVVDTDVDQTTTQLVKKIRLGLERTLAKTEKARSVFSDAWDFIKRVEAAGVKLKEGPAEETEELLLEEFSYSLADLSERVCSTSEEQTLFSAHYDGMLMLIDEADNASETLRLGSFFKLLTERLHRRGCNRIVFGLAGLPELRNVLLSSHVSSLRLFDELTLGRLSSDEINQVIDICLDDANKANIAKTILEHDARGALAAFSEGYPHFIQQFGYSAFAADTDDQISMEDVFKGAFGKGGAMELIGDRYYRDNFYTKIQAEDYRQVLRIMADNLDGWVSKKDIRAKFKGRDSTLNNAIKALRDRQIILSKEGEPGIYRLQHKGFSLWMKMYTTDPIELKQTLSAPPENHGNNPNDTKAS